MIKENSAGTIVFRVDKNDISYLILYKKKSERYRAVWDFPKGNVEATEREEETAKREAEEETGIKNIAFIEKFKEKIEFFYRREGEMVHKQIIFLLAETKQKDIRLSYEHSDYKWCSYEEALNLLTHKNSKEILTKADEFLKEYRKQKRLI